ncbi:hypothetical protein K1719_035953 [Acacia pycnantha]|nr:hypothetical protein K1719_035953 [Acacia pycnantha]
MDLREENDLEGEIGSNSGLLESFWFKPIHALRSVEPFKPPRSTKFIKKFINTVLTHIIILGCCSPAGGWPGQIHTLLKYGPRGSKNCSGIIRAGIPYVKYT